MKLLRAFLTVQVCMILTDGATETTAKDHRYYCDGKCGVTRQRCSCQYSCAGERNCCTDFRESCEGSSSWRNMKCSTAEEMTCPRGYEEQPLLIVLSIDGFRDTYIDRGLTPTIQKLASCGVKIPHMISAYPTKTFTNHYTLATGLYPESHGIISNTIYDHERGMKFRPGNSDSFSPHWWGGEPIWVTASNQGLRSASYFWPGSEINITRYPDYYLAFNASISLEERAYQTLDWLDLPEERRPSVLMIYQDRVDRAGHKGGPFGAKVNESLVKADNMVEMIMNGLRDRNLENCVNFIIVSDHGMAPVDCTDKATYLDPYINVTEFTFDDGAFVRIGKSTEKSLWYKYNPVEIKKKMECKREKTHWEAYLKNEYLPKRFHYANNRFIEDVHLVVDDEWWAGPSEDFSCNPGEHGYDNRFVDMRAFFTAHGPAFKRSYKRKNPFESIELYNLYSNILGVNPAPNNGTPGSLYDLMQKPPILENNRKYFALDWCPVSHGERWTCPSCQGASEDELTKKLLLASNEAKKVQREQNPHGTNYISKRGSNYCALIQRSYTTVFDRTRRIPLISSFVLSGEADKEIPKGPFCTQRDIRVDDETSFSCTSSGSKQSNAFFTYLIPPGIVDEIEASVSSNLVPAYKPFVDIWNFVFRSLIKWEKAYGGLSVQAGPIYDYNYDGHADNAEAAQTVDFSERGTTDVTQPPTHYFIIISRCLDHRMSRNISVCSQSLEKVEFLNFIIPNFKEMPCHKEGERMGKWLPQVLSQHIARMKDIELLTGITFLSKWTSKRSTDGETLQAIRRKLVLPDTSNEWLMEYVKQEPISGAGPIGLSFAMETLMVVLSAWLNTKND